MGRVRSPWKPGLQPLPRGWVCTAKSRSTLLFFPLGFLCVREPRYAELRSKESSKPVVREERWAAAPHPPHQRFQ